MISSVIVNKDKLENAVDNAACITNRNIIKFQDHMPIYTSSNGTYPYQKNTETADVNYNWARGFWAGIVWLLHEVSPKDYIRIYGERLTKNINSTLLKRGLMHSNLGFLVIPACIPDLRVTKSTIAKETIIMAANSLITKYDANNRFICYYDHELEGDTLCCITSNLINSQLLNYAYKLSGNVKYREIAKNDFDAVLKNNITSEGKTYFNSYINRKNGEKLDGPTALINRLGDNALTRSYTISDGTSTRAYAWALYGLTVNYGLTKDKVYRDTFSRVFDFFETNALRDKIYFSNFSKDKKRYSVDSTSSSIIAAALSDFIKHDENKEEKYISALKWLANSLIDHYSISADLCLECLVSSAYLSEHKGTTSNLIGDYFYFEMLMNLYKNRESIWYTAK